MQRPEPTRGALRIGTRGSELALVQARWVAARLADASVATELVIMRTEGDDRAPDTAWGEGAFQGDYAAFHRAIADRMPPSQTPNHYLTGQASPAYDAQRPFDI